MIIKACDQVNVHLKVLFINTVLFFIRVQKTSELLAFIQTLKMYSWEVLFANKIMDNRLLEVKHLSVWNYIYFLYIFFSIIWYYISKQILFNFLNSDSEIFGCLVCILLGYYTYPFFFLYFWTFYLDGSWSRCCHGMCFCF